VVPAVSVPNDLTFVVTDTSGGQTGAIELTGVAFAASHFSGSALELG
jgi:hypothetical protein